MKNTTKFSLQIWLFVFSLSIIFFIIALFLYQEYSSVSQFIEDFPTRKNFILLFFILCFSIIVSFLVKYIFNNIFSEIENYNSKLKDYNHYLAHELKTPIAVINSNLEVLEYWYDKEKIIHSKNELKSMTNIINWLLQFSEAFNNIEKKEINLENFIKSYLTFSNYTDKVFIHNKEFNFSLNTDTILFERVIKNLIENGLKYSLNNTLDIFIKSDRLVFENKVYKNITNDDLEKIFNKFYSKTCNENSWSWIWLPLIKEIVKVLGFELILSPRDGYFVVEIVY